MRISGIPRSKESSYPALFMAGVMHAREFLGLTSHLYFITKIIYLAQHNDANVLDLLKRTNIYSVPIVNIDGLSHISKVYQENKTFIGIRKNRQKYKDCLKDEYAILIQCS